MMMVAVARSIKQQAAIYAALFRIKVFEMLTYMTDMFGSGLMLIFRLWIFVQLYTVTYASTNVTVVNGFTLPMVIWVLFITQAMARGSGPALSYVIDRDVKEGALAASLTKPLSYLRSKYVQTWGQLIPGLIVSLGMAVVPMYLFVGAVPLVLPGLLLGMLSLCFGVTISFLCEAGIGLSALWIEDSSGIRWIYGKLIMVFGGMMIPLALLPDTARHIAGWLPFANLYNTGAELMVRFSWPLAFRSLAVQILWLVIMSVSIRYLFHKGLKHVSINGG